MDRRITVILPSSRVVWLTLNTKKVSHTCCTNVTDGPSDTDTKGKSSECETVRTRS